MINEILEVNKISKKTNFEYIFNFSKIEKIHIQSPSLIKIKDSKERAKYFTELNEILDKNKFVKNTIKIVSVRIVKINLNSTIDKKYD